MTYNPGTFYYHWISLSLKAKDLLQDLIDSNFRFYKKVTDDELVGKYFLETLFARYLTRSAASIRE